MRGRIGLVGAMAAASLLLAGCSAGPATFTIDGTWQFGTSAVGAVWAAPCDFPPGSVIVKDGDGKELAHSAYGLFDGNAVCNAYFKIKGVPESAKSFMFSVPGYDDPTEYSRDDVDLIKIISP
jgi:hypothetical protein